MAPRPPNYRQQRSDRDRAKDQKKKDRLARREDDARRRKELRGEFVGEARPDESAPEPETE